jgi:hypothetical protein
MSITRSTAVLVGTAGIAAALGFEWFQAQSCFALTPLGMLLALVPAAFALSPAVLWLASTHPLNAVGAVLFVAPLLALAYHAGCVNPPAGASPSLVFLALVIYGFHLGVLGAVVAGAVWRRLGISVVWQSRGVMTRETAP